MKDILLIVGILLVSMLFVICLKRLIPILMFLLSILSVHSADIVTATITITNIPSAGDTLTVYGARTWRVSPTIPASEILIGASIGASATNLYNQIASAPYSPSLLLGFSSSNVITLRSGVGVALAPSASGTYCTISLATNTAGGEIIVRVPMSALSNQARTNQASLLVTGIGDYAQNSFSSTATALANYVSKSEQQTITGNKVFDGNLITITNGTVEFYLSDLSFFTNAILRFREGSYLQFDTNVWILDLAGNTNWAFSNVDATNRVSTLLDITNRLTSLKADTNTWSGPNTFSGANALSGSMAGGTYFSPGMTNGILTNTTFRGQSTFTSDAAYTRANHTSLANGSNAGIDFGSETVFAKIKAGPTAAFSINGITGGRNGRELFLYNSTAQTWTFANESGVDATAANRITTMTGADVTHSGPSFAHVVYDSETSRWLLDNAQGISGSQPYYFLRGDFDGGSTWDNSLIYSNSNDTVSAVFGVSKRGRVGDATASPASGGILGQFRAGGWNGSAYVLGPGWRGDTTEAWTGANNGSKYTIFVVPNGSATTSDAFQIDNTTTAGNTRMLLYDVDNGTLERVTVGAADSGGAGFKVLRIPN